MVELDSTILRVASPLSRRIFIIMDGICFGIYNWNRLRNPLGGAFGYFIGKYIKPRVPAESSTAERRFRLVGSGILLWVSLAIILAALDITTAASTALVGFYFGTTRKKTVS